MQYNLRKHKTMRKTSSSTWQDMCISLWWTDLCYSTHLAGAKKGIISEVTCIIIHASVNTGEPDGLSLIPIIKESLKWPLPLFGPAKSWEFHAAFISTQSRAEQQYKSVQTWTEVTQTISNFMCCVCLQHVLNVAHVVSFDGNVFLLCFCFVYLHVFS